MKIYHCLLLFLLLCPPPVLAGEYTGGNNITVEVPDAWLASYNDNYRQIVLTPPDKQAGVGIMVIDSGGKNSLEVAEMISREMNGGPPEKVEGADNYYFTAKVQGMESRFIITAKDSKVLIYSEFGDIDKHDAEIQNIWQSMKSTDQQIQAVLNTIAAD